MEELVNKRDIAVLLDVIEGLVFVCIGVDIVEGETGK